MHVDYELAEVLTEQFNAYAVASEDMETLEVEWVLEHLQGSFLPEDLELLVDDDFGRGMIMGQLRTLWVMESLSEDEES